MISLIELLKSITLEGGNVFGTTSSIKKEYIKMYAIDHKKASSIYIKIFGSSACCQS